ncbi:MAG: DNA polymerase I [Synergistaceae bacterium]|nr:DNA polymerase I [Synergistaceae bacterium]
MEKILIIDGHGLAHRAFHALDAELTAPDGTPTNMITGFTNMLTVAKGKVTPRCVVAVFDAPGPTFRHERFPQYKANRTPAPPELKLQFPLLQDLLRRMGCAVLMERGVEADDVIASLALRVARERKYQAVILSSDKDLLQVLGDGIAMLRPVKRGVSAAELFDAATFEEEFGFPPASMLDYLSLLGDAVDNVPGVRGIGEKGAKDLISRYKTLDALYGALEELKPTTRKKLEEGREAAFESRDLIRLKLDVPVDLETCLNTEADLPGAVELATKLALNKLLQKLQSPGLPQLSPTPEPAQPLPLSPLLPRQESEPDSPSGPRPPRLLTADANGLIKQGKLPSLDNVWDFRTAHYLLHPDTSAKNFTPPQFTPFMSDSPEAAPAIVALYQELDAEIDRYKGLRAVMEELDLPLLPVLDRMERWGVRLNPEKFAALQSELEERVGRIEAEITALAGGVKINLNSPQQVASLLFEKLGFIPQSKTKGKTGYSTNAAVLEHLARFPGDVPSPGREVPALLLEHRELSKMLSAFVVPFQKAAEQDNGVIHTTFESAFTGTGRLSSRDPNLQNIPTFGQWADRIKEGLIPVREEGSVFVAADYSQIELRVLAHLSQEPRLLEAFQNGRDIHRETAAWVFNMAPDFVTPDLRRVAKMINFGLLYGMSSFGLAERLDMPRSEASRIVKRYFAALPGIENFLDEIVSRAREAGYARTLAGRIRPIDEVTANGKVALDRVLINTPIQGTAADIARRAMIDFDRAFASDGEVRLFLQVHDSLVCECPESRAEEVGEALREVMMNAAHLSLPLEVQLKTGRSLAEV